MKNQSNHQRVRDESFAPRWAQRLRDFGIHVSYALEGWEKVPRPQTRVVVCVVGGLWTIVDGPPEPLTDLVRLLGVDGE